MNRSQQVVAATADLVASTAGPLAAIGIDAVDIAGFGRDVEFGGDTFLAQCFTPAELEHCDHDLDKLATRFALKEAALKALGTGIRGIGLHDITIDTASSGEPRLVLSVAAAEISASRHLGPLRCTATREAGLALAVVAAGHSSNRTGE
jgi:holo-[acyl-carrier protein] synthase